MIRYYRCATCHKRGLDKSRNGRQRFCSVKCSNAYFTQKRYGTKSCPYNPALDCKEHKCSTCSWNTSVAKMRVEALL